MLTAPCAAPVTMAAIVSPSRAAAAAAASSAPEAFSGLQPARPVRSRYSATRWGWQSCCVAGARVWRAHKSHLLAACPADGHAATAAAICRAHHPGAAVPRSYLAPGFCTDNCVACGPAAAALRVERLPSGGRRLAWGTAAVSACSAALRHPAEPWSGDAELGAAEAPDSNTQRARRWVPDAVKFTPDVNMHYSMAAARRNKGEAPRWTRRNHNACFRTL